MPATPHRDALSLKWRLLFLAVTVDVSPLRPAALTASDCCSCVAETGELLDTGTGEDPGGMSNNSHAMCNRVPT